MKRMQIAVCLALVAGLAGYWYSDVALGQGDDTEGRTIELSRKLSSTTAKIVTPADVLPSANRWSGTGGRAVININGVAMMIRAETGKIGLDLDGNGTIGAKEWSALGGSADAAFKIPLETDSRRTQYLGVVMKDVIVSSDKRISGRVAPASCMEGKLNGKYIRLFDDNLDGQFTQDGNDAIAIGRTSAAVPLLTTHAIGNKFYQLTVASDGTSVTFVVQEDVVVAEVITPIKSRVLGAMVISDGQQAYDLKVTDEIPPGNYKLVYGYFGSRGPQTVMTPSPTALTYEVKADMVNTLQIGGPLWIEFRTQVNGNTFKIGPPLTVYGIGGEQYTSDFDSGGNASLPVIAVSVDGKTVSSKSMEYG